ncbi:MAG: peptide chain release factor N(5)-glutamine methyltransferase [Atopobiaceae bacterium]|nr:peptide chain release factor N(5)-glutamine methyltransferase [Atopobiaceae bacterium]
MPGADIWTVRRVLEWTRDYLGRKGDEHPRLSAEWLLSNATGLSRVEIYTNFDKPLTASELSRMHAGVERRAKGEPLQYVTGEMPFRHIVLACNRGVLIPRPETEILVDEALAQLDRIAAARDGERAEDGLLALEIGTGTGCIALSLASERPGVRVVATDISPDAIALSTRNRDALGLAESVEIVECDLASGVDGELFGCFDLLISNPPYIPTPVMAVIPDEVVDFEPSIALDGGADGLDVFRRILEIAPVALRPGGAFCAELFEESLDAAADLVREQGGWGSIDIVEDLTHRPRVLVCVRED